jgi:hypothetical protein
LERRPLDEFSMMSEDEKKHNNVMNCRPRLAGKNRSINIIGMQISMLIGVKLAPVVRSWSARQWFWKISGVSV